MSEVYIRGRKGKAGVDDTLKCNSVRMVGLNEIERTDLSDAGQHGA